MDFPFQTDGTGYRRRMKKHPHVSEMCELYYFTRRSGYIATSRQSKGAAVNVLSDVLNCLVPGP
jgi:hypothetical protein